MAYDHTAFVPISEPKIGRSRLLPYPFMSVPPTSTVTTTVKVKAYNYYIRKSQDSSQSTPILTCPRNFLTMDEGGGRGFRFNAILIGLLGVISGAIIVATYHLVYSVWNYCRRQMLDSANTSQIVEYIQQETPSDGSRSVSTPRLIPIIKYDEGSNEEMCAICLGDFKEGEQIRVLQDCLHFFHVACIDKWLNLHSSCPLCRADTSSLPEEVAVSLPGSSRTPPLELYRLPDLRV